MFRFSIREILLFTVIVAILTTWWLDHRKQLEKVRQSELEQIKQGSDFQSVLLEMERQKIDAESWHKIVAAYRRAGYYDATRADGSITVGKDGDHEIKDGFGHRLDQ